MDADQNELTSFSNEQKTDSNEPLLFPVKQPRGNVIGQRPFAMLSINKPSMGHSDLEEAAMIRDLNVSSMSDEFPGASLAPISLAHKSIQRNELQSKQNSKQLHITPVKKGDLHKKKMQEDPNTEDAIFSCIMNEN